MLIACWAAKGGSGLSVTTAGVAICIADAGHRDVVLVDLAGELPAALGIGPLPELLGLADWAASSGAVDLAVLDELGGQAGTRLRLITRGSGAVLDSAKFGLLLDLLAVDDRVVIVDCGVLDPSDTLNPRPDAAAVADVLERADHSLLVTRPCYLALRRAAQIDVEPTGVVLVKEAHRSLHAADIADVLGASIVAKVAVDPAVARVVDAGMLAARLPRSFARSLMAVADFCHAC